MSYRNKVYVCFDADSDIRFYNLMKAWKQNDDTHFNFQDAHDINNIWNESSEMTIKRRLRERLNNSKVLVVLIGDKTKNLYKYVKWEIDEALKLDMPIICVNLNGKRKLDKDLCPPVVRDELAIHISYNSKILQYSLENWLTQHKTLKSQNEKEAYHYFEEVYESLDL